MPQRWRVIIEHPDPASVTRSHLHAMVSRWLDIDHHANAKPYSLVPLYAWEPGLAAFEVGALSPDVGVALRQGLAVLRRDGGRLGREQCRSVGQEPELVASASWEELWERAEPRRTIDLRFDTPTTFRAGRLPQPLPLPSSVVRSWSGRWADFAPPRLAALVDLNVSKMAVVVRSLDGRTMEVETPGRPLIAFVGDVSFQNHERGPTGDSVGRRLDALASIAEYAGTGSSTAAGLGVTTYHR